MIGKGTNRLAEININNYAANLCPLSHSLPVSTAIKILAVDNREENESLGFSYMSSTNKKNGRHVS